MNKITLIANFAAVTMLLALAPACSHQRVLTMQDHPTDSVTKMETLKTTRFLWWAKQQHQFWICADQGEKLSCDLECGGDNDLSCPMGIAAGNISTSNVQ